MDIYYSTIKFFLRSYQRILGLDYRASWEAPLPPGPKIIAANHPNATDGFFLPFLFKEKLYFFVQWDLFKIPFFGWLLTKSKQVPVLPGKREAALEQAGSLLAQGKTVVIFPEAQLNPGGQPVKAKTGAVRLSLMTSAPIIPVGFFVPTKHVHNFKIKKKDSPGEGRWQTGGHCYIRFGSPWSPGLEASENSGLSAARELTAKLMEKIDSQAHRAYQAFFHDNHLPMPAIINHGLDEKKMTTNPVREDS